MRFLVSVRNEIGELERDYVHGPGPVAPVTDSRGRQIVFVEHGTPCGCCAGSGELLERELGPVVPVDYCWRCSKGWRNTTGELPGACPGCGRELINVGMGREANCDGSYAPPARAPR